VLMAALVCTGCVSIGPPAISNGRMAYNEVINYTEDQQLLNAIIRDRYGHTFSLLSVSSITANVKFRSAIDTEFKAWGESGDVRLIPLSAGVGYEDNPTISYAPVNGELTLRQLTSPIGVDEGFLLLSFARDRSTVSRYVYKRVNDLFIPEQGMLPDEVVRMQALNGVLFELSVLEFGIAPDSDPADPSYVLIISNYSDAESGKIREYLALLDIDPDIVDGEPVVIPIGPNAIDHHGNFISFATRSVYARMKLAGSMIELPEPYVSKGIVDPDDNWEGPESDCLITIRSSSRQGPRQVQRPSPMIL